MSDKLAYKITRRPAGQPRYDVKCLICDGESPCWDYRRNAVWAARSHIQAQHPTLKRRWGTIPVERLLNPGTWKGATTAKEARK